MKFTDITESSDKCPHCGGPMFSEMMMMEKKDACYYKVKASAKVWPSAYASGRLVQCRKKGAANYGNKSKNEGVAEGKEDKIAQLKKDYDTAVHWSKNDTNPHKREAARQKAEKINAHLEKQYKQGVAEGLNEFAEKPESGPGSDEYEDLLFHLAWEIWSEAGDSAQAERKLSLLGWKPEFGDDYTAMVLYKIGSNDHRQYTIDEFEEYGESDNEQGVAEGDMYGDQEVSWEKGGRRAPTGAFRNPADDAQKKYAQDTAAMAQGELANKMPRTAPTTPRKDPKMGMQEEYNAEYDDEAGMADNNLETLQRAVEGIDDLIQSGDNLPEWCQEKIAVAKSMLVAVWDYMYSEEASDEVDPEIDAMFEAMDQLAEEMAAKNRVSKDLVWEQFEAMPDNVLYETAAWRRKEGKSKKGGLNAKGVASYRRENPGSKLQMAVTTKPSKLKKGSKAAKRRKSFCARMGGVKGPMKKPNGKPTRKALALRKWNC